MTNPILLVQAEANERSRKSAGGNTKPPIVEVTRELRDGLGDQVSALASRAEEVGATPLDPLPVKIGLRPQALAKSNRPYDLLKELDLLPVAATLPNQLIVAGTAGRLARLESTLRHSLRKTYLYPISTFKSFTEWNALAESREISGQESLGEAVTRAISEDRPLLVTFFPWATSDVREETRHSALIYNKREMTGTIEKLQGVVGSEVEVAGLDSHRPYAYVYPGPDFSVEQIQSIRGIRTMTVALEYGHIRTVPQSMKFVRNLAQREFELPSNEDPVVGVLDTGISGDFIEPAVVGRDVFDPLVNRDSTHGTFVAGLAIASRQFNGASFFPEDKCRVYDGQVLPAAPVSEDLLLVRIADIVEANPEIRVWNCSFGAPTQGEPEYGVFAQELDVLSKHHNVLFVQAAGNYENFPQRKWPPVTLDDSIMSPAEAVLSLTVGARAHNGGLVPPGKPSSYSRRGPNFASHIKPEVCHWAGDVDSSGRLNGHGIFSTIPQGSVAEGVGTSFSTPIVASIAANVWHQLESGPTSAARPELVRGLLVHAAALADRSTEEAFRNYYGWGVPPSSAEILSDLDTGFTTVHEVTLAPGIKWTKAPFPVPASLLTAEGKFRGEVIVTVAYAPPINPAFGAEAVRYDVHGAFGSVQEEKFSAITVPDVAERAQWEADRVLDGKWSPVKSYRKKAPQGVAGGTWALRLEMTERVQDEISVEQRAYAIVTLRALDDSLTNVYQEGVAAIAKLQYRSQTLVQGTSVRVEASGR